MALTPCLECGKEISTQALSCPACGARTPRATRVYATVAIVSVLLVTIAGVWWKAQPTAAERPSIVATVTAPVRIDSPT